MPSVVSGTVFLLLWGFSEYPEVNWIISFSYSSFSSSEIVGKQKAENDFITDELNYLTTTTSKSELLKQRASFSAYVCTTDQLPGFAKHNPNGMQAVRPVPS